MEEMKKAAIACYERADADTQQMAKQFFNSMDKDGNGKITRNEFMEALKQLGYKESEENELATLFEKLDTNRDKHLDFNEAVVFYYIINHKTAVFCNGCCAFLAGVYFSCLECHVLKDGSRYDLCIDCYRKGKSDEHMHKTLFDNHHLLQLYRNLGANEEANNAKENVIASSGGKRYALARLFRTVGDPDSANNGTGTGTGITVSSLEQDAGGDIGSAGVAKRGFGIVKLAERGARGVSHASDAISDACSIM